MKTFVRILAVIIFIIGAVVGIAFFGLATWGDFESSLFESLIIEEGRIGISCPVFIDENEEGVASITIKNPTDDPIKNRIWLRMTDGFVSMIKESRERYELEPGEAMELSWPFTADDAAYGGRLILVKVSTDPTYPLPGRQASCGIIVIRETGLTGSQAYWLILSVSVISMGVGMAMWWLTNQPMKGRNYTIFRAMLALAIIIIAGIVTTLTGSWLIGGILLIVAVLVVGAMLMNFFATG